ncbi:Gaa1-like, GPI transamidase component domain containing protein [Amanita muscaria]
MNRLRNHVSRLTIALKSHETRLRRRQAVTAWFTRRAMMLRIVLFVVGYAWIISVPSPRLARGTYMDENALQPAQVNMYWNWGDVNNADRYLEELERLYDVNATSEQRAQFFKAEFTKLGIAASTQSYSYTVGNTPIKGVNAYAVLPSPRTSGTEAMVISASWMSRMDEDQGTLNLRGVSSILALAAFLKRYSLWAKDIVFVLSDGHLEGMHAWLSAYHGDVQSNLMAESLSLSSGIIWTALNLDYPGHSFSHLGVFFEGCNGRLPNQDLQNSLHRIALSNGVPVTVYDHIDTDHQTLPAPFNWLPEHIQREIGAYCQQVKNVLRHLGYQARGQPSGVHGLYHQFRIDAVTLFAVPATGPHGFHSIGRVIESTLRTMNNLLERLHASFFFFMLTAPDRFLKIGSYLPSVLLISVAMMFGGLTAWNGASQSSDKKRANSVNASDTSRPVLSSLILMASTHVFGVLLFWALSSAWYSDRFYLVSLTLTACSVLPIVGFSCVANRADISGHSLTLKAFNLCLASTVVSITAVLNFSLALVLAVFLGVPLSISSSSKSSRPRRLVKYAFYVILALGWLTLAPREVKKAMWHWEALSVWFAPFICMVYVPLALQAGLVCLL